jgi:hypothetical protein
MACECVLKCASGRVIALSTGSYLSTSGQKVCSRMLDFKMDDREASGIKTRNGKIVYLPHQ